MFTVILHKVRDKTQGWSKKYLSQGGKDVLLKVVALALPVYTMNIFKLAKKRVKRSTISSMGKW